VEEHVLADGTVGSRTLYEHEGCLTRRVLIDTDGDGVADQVTAYERDGEGRVVRETQQGPGGFVDVWSYGYDGRGDLVLSERDSGGDGVVDYRVEKVRDARGLVIEERAYAGAEIVSLSVAVRDDEGRISVLEEHSLYCDDRAVFTGDEVGVRTTYTRDGAGDAVLEEVDGVACGPADGVVDMRIERVFDGDGRLLREDVDGSDATAGLVGGALERCVSYAYDGGGSLVRIAWDGDGSPGSCDGEVDGVTVERYVGGRLHSSEHDAGADGTLDEIWSYEYDPCGNRVGWSLWRAEMGATAVRHTYDYSCWE
jgi:hypothetical protein